MHLRSAPLSQVSELRGPMTRERETRLWLRPYLLCAVAGREPSPRLCDFYKSVLSAASRVVRCASAGWGRLVGGRRAAFRGGGGGGG